MIDNDTSAALMLKSHGLKATSQRMAVYEAMRTLGHASADSVCRTIQEQGGTATVATVYNVLESFAEHGILSRRFSSNNKMYFDVTTAPHCHFYDTVTDTIVDYDDPALNILVQEYTANHHLDGFELSGIDIQIIGHKTEQ